MIPILLVKNNYNSAFVFKFYFTATDGCQERRVEQMGSEGRKKKTHLHDADIAFKQCDKLITGNKHSNKLNHQKNKESTHYCNECDKVFTRKDYLKHHTQIVHLKLAHLISKFKCHLCNKGFSRLTYMTRHVGTHLGIKYHCKVCGKDFTRKCGLMVHIHTVHLKLSHLISKYKCHLCNKGSSRLANIRRHVVTHLDPKFTQDVHLNNHHCNECGKYFTRKSSLKHHIHSVHLTHLKSKFKCHICNKGFSRLVNIKRHVVTHLEPKLKPKYPCNVCGKDFTRKSSIKHHIQTQHNV